MATDYMYVSLKFCFSSRNITEAAQSSDHASDL